jgi:glycosidase
MNTLKTTIPSFQKRVRGSKHALAAIALALACGSFATESAAQNVSAPAILSWYETSYRTIERRGADLHAAGYGGIWIPPVGRAETGNTSVGYDVYDRFDLGSPGNSTLYGTETGLKRTVRNTQKAGARVYVDLVWNHNGFADLGTPGFQASGAYPGFVLTHPNAIDGDFHSGFAGGTNEGRLSGLIDIDHETNFQYIRNPVPGFANNIPAGTVPFFGELANIPSENNRRFYPDQQQSGHPIVFNPRTGQTNIPLYDFNTSNPMGGDPVPENALGYLMRNARWLVQEVGIDGYRMDAIKHFEPWVLDYYDQAVYRAIKKPLLNGQTQHVFAFGEHLDGNSAAIQPYIRKDINPAQPGTVGGNRDALDFPLFFAMRDNLSNNGFNNDWRNIVNASLDRNDDGLANNGSQGLSFVRSHDDFGAHLDTVAHAYILMRPGNAIVYFNGKEFGQGRDFPKDGRGDALGGQYGQAITKLVSLRNQYGRGNYLERWIDKETLVYERQNSVLVGLNNRLDSGFDTRTVNTSFAPGTPLIELTGNATNATLDPNNDIFDYIVVAPNGQATLRVPRNSNNGSGYVMYGPATPQGSMTISNVAFTLNPDTATPTTNGTARVNAIDVIRSSSFNVTLNTTPVTIPGYGRDIPADGDNAIIKINDGVNINGNTGVDYVDPNGVWGTVSYAFENFVTKNSPLIGGGDGQFIQTINAAALGEGYHFIEVRAFRQRNISEPAVFSTFKRTVYVDLLPPDSDVKSFTAQGLSQNRRVTAQSLDMTGDNIHVFLNLPAGLTEAQIFSQVGGGSQGNQIDRDLWTKDFTNLTEGNHVITLVTYEITGTYNIERIPGFFVDSPFGLGFGDVNFDNILNKSDILLFEELIESRNRNFNPAADLNGDGLLDLIDVTLLGDALRNAGAAPSVIDLYEDFAGSLIAIPEPSSLAVLSLAGLLSLRRRKPEHTMGHSQKTHASKPAYPSSESLV